MNWAADASCLTGGQTYGKLTAKRLRKLRNNYNLQACTGVPIRCPGVLT